MQLDGYDLKRGRNFTVYTFTSKGSKGNIKKTIQFQLLGENIYNLAFGDSTEEDFDDLTVTGNGDTIKVLATVAHSVYLFTTYHPDAWIFAQGSTMSRTRLYRMGITRYLNIIEKDFDIIGETAENWEVFQVGKMYSSFAVRRKIINLNYENSD